MTMKITMMEIPTTFPFIFQAWYLIDPASNLEGTRERMKLWVEQTFRQWDGVVGKEPDAAHALKQVRTQVSGLCPMFTIYLVRVSRVFPFQTLVMAWLVKVTLLPPLLRDAVSGCVHVLRSWIRRHFHWKRRCST